MHIFPKVIDVVVKLAKKYNVKHVRIPFEHVTSGLIHDFSKTAKIKMIQNKLKTTDAFYGILNMHDMNFDKMSIILKSIKNGINELMVHPAYIDKNGDSFHQSRQREEEIKLLKNNKIKQLIKKQNINLTNFLQL